MNLSLDDPNRATQLLSSRYSLIHRKSRNTSWDRHAKSAQDLFALVLMNLHRASLQMLCSCRT